MAKIFVTDEAIEKIQTKLFLHRWSDKIGPSLWIPLMKRHKFLDDMFFPAMKRYNWSNFVRFLAFLCHSHLHYRRKFKFYLSLYVCEKRSILLILLLLLLTNKVLWRVHIFHSMWMLFLPSLTLGLEGHTGGECSGSPIKVTACMWNI